MEAEWAEELLTLTYVEFHIAGFKIFSINHIYTWLFDNCNGSYALFRFLDCKQVNFNNSLLCNADFYKAKLLKVGFNDSNLQQTGMSGAKLKGVDLSSCKIDGLGVTVDDLDGCIVSPEQVISFSNLLGLKIKS